MLIIKDNYYINYRSAYYDIYNANNSIIDIIKINLNVYNKINS